MYVYVCACLYHMYMYCTVCMYVMNLTDNARDAGAEANMRTAPSDLLKLLEAARMMYIL